MSTADSTTYVGQLAARASMLLPGIDLSERLELLGAMSPDEMSASLAWLAGYAPAAFDAALVRDAALVERLQDRLDADGQEDDDDLEPYCKTCGASIGIFIGHGEDWRHYRGNGTPESRTELYDAGHLPVVAWHWPGEQ